MSELFEGHTVRRFDGEMGQFHLSLLQMGGLVLDQCREAVAGLESGDPARAGRVLDRQHDVISLERRLDQLAMEIVSRRAPVARDLRFVISFAKVVSELKQAGNAAVRVARFALGPSGTIRPGRGPTMELKRMSDPVLGLLERAINLLDNLDAELADAIFERHENLEPEFEHCLRRLSTLIWEDTRVIGPAIEAILILKSLQRIGDRCKNVAEYVVYAVTGMYRDVGLPGGIETPSRKRP